MWPVNRRCVKLVISFDLGQRESSPFGQCRSDMMNETLQMTAAWNVVEQIY